MGNVLIGVDIGSAVLKAAAFDGGNGTCLARTGSRLALRVGDDGAREQSPSALLRAMDAALGHLRRKLGGRWRDARGISLAAQGGSAIIADRLTGKPRTPMMLWNDMRAFGYLPGLASEAPGNFWRQRTLRDGPGWGLARMRWLKDTRPRLMREQNIYVGAGEYGYFHLTGVWRQDACNALQIGCYDARRERLDQALLDFAGMPLSFVAPLRDGHRTGTLTAAAGRLLGLPAGLPVAGPYMDHEAGYLSALGASKRPLQCSLGTAWVGNFTLPPNRVSASLHQLVLPPIAQDGRLVVQPLLTGNVTWDWGLERFVDSDHRTALRKLGRIFRDNPLPPAGLAALPWLNMPNPMRPSSIGGGAFSGIGASTTEADLLRALAAGMAYEMVRVFRRCVSERVVDSVILGGGASKGEFFRAFFATLFAPLPVRFVKEGDTMGARGCLYAFSPETARAETIRVPLPGRDLDARLRDGYEHYRKVFERLYGDVSTGSVSFQRRTRA